MAASKVTQGEATVSSGQEELHALILTRGGLYCCTEPCLCDGGLTAFVLAGAWTSAMFLWELCTDGRCR